MSGHSVYVPDDEDAIPPHLNQVLQMEETHESSDAWFPSAFTFPSSFSKTEEIQVIQSLLATVALMSVVVALFLLGVSIQKHQHGVQRFGSRHADLHGTGMFHTFFRYVNFDSLGVEEVQKIYTET